MRCLQLNAKGLAKLRYYLEPALRPILLPVTDEDLLRYARECEYVTADGSCGPGEEWLVLRLRPGITKSKSWEDFTFGHEYDELELGPDQRSAQDIRMCELLKGL